jgi:hypothetical protein
MMRFNPSKILFISPDSFDEKFAGGNVVSFRNFNIVCNYFGKENVELFYLYKHYTKNKIIKKMNLLFYRWYGLDRENESIILDKILNKDFVWIEYSLYGRIAKLIKKKYPNMKIISFWHNVEKDYAKQKQPYNFIYQKIIQKNEFLMCFYSDFLISLNSRDSLYIENFYGKKSFIMPVSFPNRYIDFNRNIVSVQPTVLFLGSNFYANIHGIKWFVNQVLPFVDIRLKIIGRDMDKANLPKNEKILVIGYVENLEECMQNADFMIFPIFKGSGMKVKTCEALMHGKNIIGTGEAFMGYDVDFEKVGARCETAEEFIKAINEFPKRFTSKFNEYSRNVFLEKYTNDVVFKQFAEVFE